MTEREKEEATARAPDAMAGPRDVRRTSVAVFGWYAVTNGEEYLVERDGRGVQRTGELGQATAWLMPRAHELAEEAGAGWAPVAAADLLDAPRKEAHDDQH